MSTHTNSMKPALAAIQQTPVPPFRLVCDDLGLGNDHAPHIDFADSTGAHWRTDSIEFILYNIDHFSGRQGLRLLAGAVLNYGLDAYALTGADFQPTYNAVDASGRVLLAGVTHEAASKAADAYMAQPGWTGDIRIQRQPAGDVRHEGPLVLLHHSLGLTTFTGVAVKSHAGRCGMMLEEVLRRLHQFDAADQAEILAGMAMHFGVSLDCAAGQPQPATNALDGERN